MYAATKSERRKRQSRFWRNKSVSQEFVINRVAFDRIQSAGFILLDFPDNLGTAIELERVLAGFVPDDEIKLSPLQNSVAEITQVYSDVKDHLPESLDATVKASGEPIDFRQVFKQNRNINRFSMRSSSFLVRLRTV